MLLLRLLVCFLLNLVANCGDDDRHYRSQQPKYESSIFSASFGYVDRRLRHIAGTATNVGWCCVYYFINLYKLFANCSDDDCCFADNTKYVTFDI